MKRLILVLFASALTAVVIAFCVVLKYGNVELRIVEPGKSVQVNENHKQTKIDPYRLSIKTEQSQRTVAPQKEELPSERAVTFRMADVVNLSGGRYYCDASDKDAILGRDLYEKAIRTGDIIVPKGQKWVYKDYKIDYSWSGGYYPPYIVYKNKGGGKKYQLPEDGRDFILYQGDAFQLGISLPEETFEYVEVSVIFHIEYI